MVFLLPTEMAYVALLQSHSLKPEPLSLQTLFYDVSALIPGAKKFKNMDEMASVILHRRVETVVMSNQTLLAAARQAFRSFVRAYATHSADTKRIFRVSELHLGHVAKSFALREGPSALQSSDDVISKIFNGVYSRRKPNVTPAPSSSSSSSSLSSAAAAETVVTLEPPDSAEKRSAVGIARAEQRKRKRQSVQDAGTHQKLRRVSSSSSSSSGKGDGRGHGSSSSRSHSRQLRAVAPSGSFRSGGSYFKSSSNSNSNSKAKKRAMALGEFAQ